MPAGTKTCPRRRPPRSAATWPRSARTCPARPYRDAVYVPAAAVGPRPPGGDGAVRYPSAVDGVFQRARYRPDPLLWATLHRHGLTVRGPRAGDLGAAPGEEWLRDWNHGNLESYWRRWATRGRETLAGHDPGDPLPASVVAWSALGPGRLHAAITTGEIIPKTDAADYTGRLLPRHAPLLARAKAYRLGDDSETFTFAGGHAACDLIEAVADDAAALRQGGAARQPAPVRRGPRRRGGPRRQRSRPASPPLARTESCLRPSPRAVTRARAAAS